MAAPPENPVGAPTLSGFFPQVSGSHPAYTKLGPLGEEVSLPMPLPIVRLIDELAGRLGVTAAEVVARGIGLLKIVADARDAGQGIALVDSDLNVERGIINALPPRPPDPNHPKFDFDDDAE